MKRLKRSDCAVLTLVLMRKWYDMIASGEKKEEYRDVTDRYSVRFENFLKKCCEMNVAISGKANIQGRKNAVVAFSLGYTKPSMFFAIPFSLGKGHPSKEAVEISNYDSLYWSPAVIREGANNPEWGEPERPHYVIKLGERVELV